jgi:hypothetical protein
MLLLSHAKHWVGRKRERNMIQSRKQSVKASGLCETCGAFKKWFPHTCEAGPVVYKQGCYRCENICEHCVGVQRKQKPSLKLDIMKSNAKLVA